MSDSDGNLVSAAFNNNALILLVTSLKERHVQQFVRIARAHAHSRARARARAAPDHDRASATCLVEIAPHSQNSACRTGQRGSGVLADGEGHYSCRIIAPLTSMTTHIRRALLHAAFDLSLPLLQHDPAHNQAIADLISDERLRHSRARCLKSASPGPRLSRSRRRGAQQGLLGIYQATAIIALNSAYHDSSSAAQVAFTFLRDVLSRLIFECA
ncbi:hypothetical protein DOTSEDRAFT_76601 [Dothistroma septosporum NZE10]|uniref:Uncharacterized protein n=1 Tax=Dothistroma septosporum (strain NZE10 / CBS 128990) TaxID=675120 RepID=N1Q3K0_DOTSN|nr:hypothetical protein DOTSEDRAFT_76601 [Dothistroma septosporum NZE10]